MFLPQRPYLSTGTLRDQVIYPHTAVDMKDAGRRDFELSQILEEAKLGYIPDREGGWDTKKVWKDVFSGGEKQRMGIARLLYHEPRYAFVDEGTSAVSSDVEGLLYERCKAKGISKSSLTLDFKALRALTFNSANNNLHPRLPQALPRLHPHSRPRRARRRMGIPAYWHRVRKVKCRKGTRRAERAIGEGGRVEEEER